MDRLGVHAVLRIHLAAPRLAARQIPARSASGRTDQFHDRFGHGGKSGRTDAFQPVADGGACHRRHRGQDQFRRARPVVARTGRHAGLGTGHGLDHRLPRRCRDRHASAAGLPATVDHPYPDRQCSSYRLIRKVQAQNLRLDEISRHDTLTGLQTRRHWQEQARALLADNARNGMPASLLLLDVDLFKSINDDHGHAIGDDVLRGIADAIRHAIPAGSHAGRLGGDEFAVAVPLPLSETHVLAEHIRNRVQALNHDIPGVRCSVSIGLAEPSSPDIDLRGWMEDADRALYRAKAAGRNLAHAAEQPVEFVEP
ncbi:MAG: GGDEF domain-containing protein [Thermomonas sp.]|nr:MAG: GGDEF domain-containing protein [Thermomonas sp.]